MGCNSDFYNKTREEKTKKLNNWRLTRNIDRGEYTHLIRVFKEVIRINGWNEDDEITAHCCCENFLYHKGHITHLGFINDPKLHERYTLNKWGNDFETECDCEMCSIPWINSDNNKEEV
jgi:hypothetical protein